MPARNLLVAALLVAAVACTNGDGTDATVAPTGAGSAPPTSDVEVSFVRGEWTYELYGVKATFTWKSDAEPLLSVRNGSDRPVGAPDVYVVTRDQRHVDGEIANASALDPSASGDYTVTFPSDLSPDDIGLVVLELGGVNWGALGPKIAK